MKQEGQITVCGAWLRGAEKMNARKRFPIEALLEFLREDERAHNEQPLLKTPRGTQFVVDAKASLAAKKLIAKPLQRA